MHQLKSTVLSLASALALTALHLCAGCAGDVAEPYQLEHARILAVRAEPAQLGPGDVATLQALFTDSSAVPRLAAPAELEVSLPPELDRPELVALRGLLSRTAGGYQLHAPDAATLAQVRTALGVPADQPLTLTLDVQVRSADGVLRAQKQVRLGSTVANPAPPGLMVAGDQIAGDTTLRVAAGAETALTVSAPPDMATVRWFSSAGELRGYTQPAAWLTTDAQDAAASGHLAVVIRDVAGGVAWRVLALQVTP